MKYVEKIKLLSSIQVFFRKNGEVSYARARHYGANKKFYYHQQSLEYTNIKLGELDIIDPCEELGSKSVIVAGGEEFEPSFELSL